MLKSFFISLFLVFYQLSHAQINYDPTSHEPTLTDLIRLKLQPSYYSQRVYPLDDPDWQPATDDHKFRYVLVSAQATNSEAQYLKDTLAKNLPAGMKMVVLTSTGNYAAIRKYYSKLIASDRIVYATATNASYATWARDAFPVPVINENGVTSLVGVNYDRPFVAHDALSTAVKYSLKKFDFTFVGGNLLADEAGACFVVNSRRRYNSTEEDYKSAYGCKSVRLMKYVMGIGDVDEVLKPLKNKVMLTNRQEYVADLEAWGYKVVMLPLAENGAGRTYVNSLILNGTVFMPTYNVPADQKARAVYESLGFKVIGIPSSELSDYYKGSVHCQTMAYPSMNEADLFSLLNLKPLQ